ncbi:helix-turn-helix domain-containing protein [Rhodovulum euryhalinum]|uniref:Helix-turn-helix protein n=1 Tax=Rhodovulum euryhalinum TaxID=35805 RepID=A0A4R2K7Q9_9RHOB|nr:helix-turn-helix transcriptional regulator [Rhodovulum euryhalinum]TCO69401.1 helix-turn-helix protein [Rhodovulum euryhalinum]
MKDHDPERFSDTDDHWSARAAVDDDHLHLIRILQNPPDKLYDNSKLMFYTSTLFHEVSIDMITGPQIKAARALLGVDQKTLARMAGLSVPTIQRMEANKGNVRGVVDSLTRIITALETAGIELIAEGGPSTGCGRGVRLRERAGERPDAVAPGSIGDAG